MHRRRRLLATVTAGLALAGAAGCSNGGSSTPPPTGGTESAPPTTRLDRHNVDGVLRIGTLLPLTGDGAALGQSMLAGVRLAVDDINRAGGLFGRNIELTGADEGADSTEATASLGRLLGDKVDVVVGPASTKSAVAVVSRLPAASALACSPAVTSSVLTSLPDGGYFFRTIPSDGLEGAALATEVGAEGYQSIAILTSDDDYGQSVADAISKQLGTDSEIDLAARVAYDPGGGGLDRSVKRALDANPDAVVLVGLPDPGAKVIARLRSQLAVPGRTGPLPIYVTDGLRTPTLSDLVAPGQPEVLQGVRGVAPALNPPDTGDVRDRLQQAVSSGPLAYSAYAYDCVVTAALAALAAGSDDPALLRSHVGAVTRGGTLCESFSACQLLLRQNRNIDYDGPSGPIDLDDKGDPSRGWFDVFSYGADGKDVLERQARIPH